MLKPGDKIDRFRIEEPLGEGGMGRVFRAYDERLDRRVAIKVLVRDEDPDARTRLVREARAVAQLDHPNVVAVYDVGEFEGSPYIAMELVQGRSLRSIVGDALVSPTERIRYLVEVARALGAAHDAGLVHRDVKPENVIIRSDGRVKVLDFGIARRQRPGGDASAPTEASLSTLTADGVKAGTPTYMAPEQIRGDKLDGRCDQFAWGVTAYEVFVGKAPWTGNDPLAVIASVMSEEPPPPPSIAMMPHAFAGTVRRALQKRPDDRFATMHLLVAAIESASTPVQAGAPFSAPPSSMPTPPSPGSLHQPPSYPPPSHPPPSPQRPPSFSFTRRYSTQELSEIFDRALGVQKKKYAYDDVVEAAQEIGLDELTVQQAMGQLVERGAVESSQAERARAVAQAKRYAAIWGVIAGFFVLINLATWDHDRFWAPKPIIVFGAIFGFLIVMKLFPGAGKKAPRVQGDQALAADAHRMTQYLAARPRARIDAGIAPPVSSQPVSSAPPSPMATGGYDHAAEMEAQAAVEAAAQRARQRG
ncbi:MAG: serine/threonine protein kinase [Polyangiaceae bacterium]|nr:serine/threonine protein kinase [Polyangiaceae bacterium]